MMKSVFYSGKVERIYYSNPPFYIFKMRSDEGDFLSVKGKVFGMNLSQGVWVPFKGHVERDPKYGKTVIIDKAPEIVKTFPPEMAAGILRARGVGAFTVSRLVKTFKNDLVKNLEDIEALKKSSLTDLEAELIHSKWNAAVSYFKTVSLLIDAGIDQEGIKSVWSTFGDDAHRILSQEPWRVAEVIPNVDFAKLDEIALRLGRSMDSASRVRGAVVSVLRDLSKKGHLCERPKEVFRGVKATVPNATFQSFGEALKGLAADGKIAKGKDLEGKAYLYDSWAHKIESESVEILSQRVKSTFYEEGRYKNSFSSIGDKTRNLVVKKAPIEEIINSAIKEWSQNLSIELSEEQEKGIFNALRYPVSILTGLPGTGKSTSLKVLVRIFQDIGISFLMIAPTGIAAKNLYEITGVPAYTVHRAFEAKGKKEDSDNADYEGVKGPSGLSSQDNENSDWGYSRKNPHDAQIVLIDESSMMDMHLLYRVLSCTSDDCRLVVIGDAEQLPSVGPGLVLKDMIDSKAFPSSFLSKIFRQKDTSDIVFAAHDIHAGKMPKTALRSDFSFVSSSDEGEIQKAIVKIAQRLYESRSNFQVISPRHRGTLGVTELNVVLREALNPPSRRLKEVKMGHWVMRENDRVMVVRNDYERDVYNGDVGKIERIDKKNKAVSVRIFDTTNRVVVFEFKEIIRYLRMSYACTIHKVQGLQFGQIVLPIVPSFGRQLNRNLIYTAITRAKEKVILLGSLDSLRKGISRVEIFSRNSLFKDSLVREIGENG